ncbi:hypothetical protein H0H81_006195, partial [Sphagnurus paluster]
MLIDTEEGEDTNEQDNIEPNIPEEDYAPGVSDGDESGEDVSTIPKITLKPGKRSQKIDRSLREEINKARDQPPSQLVTPAIPKHKVDIAPTTGTDVKWAQKSSATTDGLPSDWRKRIITQTKLSCPGKTAPPAEESFKPGEFDEDKDVEQLAAVKQSKRLVKIGLKPMRDMSNSTSSYTFANSYIQMKTVKVHERDVKISISDSQTGNTSIKKLPISCLPLPTGPKGHTYTTQWRKEFKPTTINFAASLPQPFSANALLHNHVKQWWKLIFTFPMDEHWIWTTNSEDSLPAVVDQTSKVITEWRSSMGKKAIAILTNIFERDEMSKDEIIEWVEERRGGPIDTFRWLYADPDGPEGEKGAFLSDIVLQIFGYHLKQVSGAKKDYGLPIGGLALCTAAMECALELWSTGELPKASRKRDLSDPMVLELSSSKKKASPAM